MSTSIMAMTTNITSLLFLCPKARDWWWESKDEQSTKNRALALPQYTTWWGLYDWETSLNERQVLSHAYLTNRNPGLSPKREGKRTI